MKISKLLIPALGIAAITPTIAMTACNKEDSIIINSHWEADGHGTGYLQTEDVSHFEENKPYKLCFDLTKWQGVGTTFPNTFEFTMMESFPSGFLKMEEVYLNGQKQSIEVHMQDRGRFTITINNKTDQLIVKIMGSDYGAGGTATLKKVAA